MRKKDDMPVNTTVTNLTLELVVPMEKDMKDRCYIHMCEWGEDDNYILICHFSLCYNRYQI